MTPSLRLANRITAEGYEATVLATEGKTHLGIELEIGITGDVSTAEILKFFESQSPKVNAHIKSFSGSE